ncbi:MAG: IclR family transcriptional regulator [Natronomonas sp.]|uniref:IclR family transcriptional regulator n=1 Tax=Natronomonas sp. TaxID=2184060 RepID=UPI00287046E8|nr:IclR family transcriptional regulator [Natronomonas sp.]MDR9429400.1 IclR family transcriptional regulator [Natronomonas sp.]
MADSARYSVKAAETTFVVLDGLKELNGVGVTELAAHLDIPKSTVHSYLSTLEQEEFVVKEDGAYHVGVRFLEYGAHARKRRDVYEIAKPEIERLAEETGNLANLMIEEHGRGVYLHRGEGERAVKAINNQVGTRVYIHSTAMGKSILAHLPSDRVDAIIELYGLPPITANTIIDRATLQKELDNIRERGYAIDEQELVDGLWCIGAPVLRKTGGVYGAVSVAGPLNRFNGVYFEEVMPDKVMETANVVELNLTYS